MLICNGQILNCLVGKRGKHIASNEISLVKKYK